MAAEFTFGPVDDGAWCSGEAVQEDIGAVPCRAAVSTSTYGRWLDGDSRQRRLILLLSLLCFLPSSPEFGGGVRGKA